MSNRQAALVAGILWVIGNTMVRLRAGNAVNENMATELRTWVEHFKDYLEGRVSFRGRQDNQEISSDRTTRQDG